jgi:L-lactate dehydrogenase complex protein LldG
MGPDGSLAVPRLYRTAGDHLPGSPEVVGLLVDRLIDYKAGVAICSQAELVEAVRNVVARWSASAAQSSSDDECLAPVVVTSSPPAGVAEALAGRAVLVDAAEMPLPVSALDTALGVITGCSAAIAETGTLILDAAPDQGRRVVSLVPDRHLVILQACNVVQTVPEGMAGASPTRPLTLVSGPSATSDIELSRVEGVHGPRTLDVIVVVAPD